MVEGYWHQGWAAVLTIDYREELDGFLEKLQRIMLENVYLHEVRKEHRDPGLLRARAFPYHDYCTLQEERTE
jgi:hypothetical protein